MLMLFAELKRCRLLRDASTKASLTSRWQSSKVPWMRSDVTFSPQQVSCCSWRGLTSPRGYRMTTRAQGRR